MKITVVGLGYVGLSNAVLLARHHDVIGLDINKETVDAIGLRLSPVKDNLLAQHLTGSNLRLQATCDKDMAYRDAAYVIVSVPTSYTSDQSRLDTSVVETVVADIRAVNEDATIVLRSTLPVGFTAKMDKRFAPIIFMPEFLREGQALHDNLYPSRIIVGGNPDHGQPVADFFRHAAMAKDVPVLVMGAGEAEAVKLFANTYLAMRVAYFNELDAYGAKSGLDVRRVIQGVCLDPRIGDYYNNPSFGYGGYCLPKDSQQLLQMLDNLPQALIGAVIESNRLRHRWIADQVMELNPKIVGIYRLLAKTGSDNYRYSSVAEIMSYLRNQNISMLVYEPLIEDDTINGIEVIHDLVYFKKQADLILANRITDDLGDVQDKVYSRDLFGHG